MVNQVLVETLKIKRDIRHFLLYFIGQSKSFGMTLCQGDMSRGRWSFAMCLGGQLEIFDEEQ